MLAERRFVRPAAGMIAAIALFGALAGCSDDKSPATNAGESFTTSYRRITADLTQRSQEIKDRTAAVKSKGGDVSGVLDVYSQIRESSQQAHMELSRLSAPAPVKQPLARLVTLLAEQTDVLGDLVDAAESEDKQEVNRAMTRLVSLTRDFDTARTEMERAIAACGDACG